MYTLVVNSATSRNARRLGKVRDDRRVFLLHDDGMCNDSIIVTWEDEVKSKSDRKCPNWMTTPAMPIV
jgi:hypothetical protein